MMWQLHNFESLRIPLSFARRFFGDKATKRTKKSLSRMLPSGISSVRTLCSSRWRRRRGRKATGSSSSITSRKFCVECDGEQESCAVLQRGGDVRSSGRGDGSLYGDSFCEERLCSILQCDFTTRRNARYSYSRHSHHTELTRNTAISSLKTLATAPDFEVKMLLWAAKTAHKSNIKSLLVAVLETILSASQSQSAVVGVDLLVLVRSV